MVKKVLLVVVGVILLSVVGLAVWARSILGTDAVRTAIAAQISRQIGQPVTIGGISAAIYPRVTIALDKVTIGQASEITVDKIDVGTDFRALLSRQIEHAAMHLDGARVTLPLPPMTFGSAQPADAGAPPASSSPVQIVSIDEVVMKNIAIVSGGRTLKGDIDLVPQGNGVLVRNVALGAEGASVTVTGTITDLAGPVGALTIRAGALDIDNLIAFAGNFTTGAGTLPGAPSAPATTPVAPAAATGAPAMHIALDLQAEKATMGGLAIDKVAGKALVSPTSLTLDPIGFGLFGGTYDGTLSVALNDAVPAFHWTARIANLDVAAATAFAGSPNLVSGKLAGTIDLTGSGQDAATAMKTVHGRTRLDVTNGVVRNLGLIRAVTAATALSVEGLQKAAASHQDADEPFSRLGATITIAEGVAATDDLTFEATDLTLTSAGRVGLTALTLDLKGQVKLSEALSKQSNATLVSVTGDQGRITLPAIISGTAAQPAVKIDTTDMARRALRNALNEQGQKLLNQQSEKLLKGNPEAQKAIGGIGGLFGGKKK